MTVRYTERIKIDEPYTPKQLYGEAGLLGRSKDLAYRWIVDEYEDAIMFTWNAKRTHRCSITIPGWVVLTAIYEKTIGRQRR